MMVCDQILLLHIPKTAGNSLNKLIQLNLLDRLYRLYDGTPLFPPWISKDLFRYGTRKEFLSLDKDTQSSYKCVSGHIEFGFHRYLEYPTQYVTMLRDPIERTISHYYTAKRRHRVSISFKEFVLTDPMKIHGAVDNFQARRLCGRITPRHQILERSKANLMQCSVVGTTERFEDTARLLCKKFGWQYYEACENVNHKKPDSNSIDPKILMILEEINRHDRELYRTANAMLDVALDGI